MKIDSGQYIIYQPQAGMSKTGKITSKKLTKTKSLNPESLNKNLKAMKGFYDTKPGDLTDIKSKETSQKAGETLSQGTSSSTRTEKKSLKEEKEKKEVSQKFGQTSKKQEAREKALKKLKNNEKALKNFSDLSLDEQNKYISLTDNPMLNTYMPKILERGILKDKDSAGTTLLDNLNKLDRQKFAKGYDKDMTLDSIGETLGKPGRVSKEGKERKFYSLECESIRNNPSEHIRILSGLMSEKGEVSIPGGKILKRSKDAINNEFASVDSPGQTFQNSIRDHINSSGVSSAEKRQDIMEQIRGNKKASEAFSKLGEKDRETFLSFAEQHHTGGIDIGESKVPCGTNPDLIKIMENGKLTDKDINGHTLIDNLSEMQKREFTEKLDKKKIIEDTLMNIATPEKINQAPQTCTVTTMEYIQAKNNPAEYTRILSDLSGKEGKVKVLNGDTIERVRGEIKAPLDGPSSADRVYQLSMMGYARGDYDKNTYDTGLTPEETTKAFNAGFSYKSTLREFKPENISIAEKEMVNSLNQGKNVPVALVTQVMENGDQRGHEMAVEKMDNKYVYLRDPDGDQAAKGSFKTIVRADGKELDKEKSGGHIRIDREEFFEKLHSYHVTGEAKIDTEFKDSKRLKKKNNLYTDGSGKFGGAAPFGVPAGSNMGETRKNLIGQQKQANSFTAPGSTVMDKSREANFSGRNTYEQAETFSNSPRRNMFGFEFPSFFNISPFNIFSNPFLLPFGSFPCQSLFNPFGIPWLQSMPFGGSPRSSFEKPAAPKPQKKEVKEKPFFQKESLMDFSSIKNKMASLFDIKIPGADKKHDGDGKKNTPPPPPSGNNFKTGKTDYVQPKKTDSPKKNSTFTFESFNNKIIDALNLNSLKKEIKPDIQKKTVRPSTSDIKADNTGSITPPPIPQKEEKKEVIKTKTITPPPIPQKEEKKEVIKTKTITPPPILQKEEKKEVIKSETITPPPIPQKEEKNIETPSLPKNLSAPSETKPEHRILLKDINSSAKGKENFEKLTKKEQAEFLELAGNKLSKGVFKRLFSSKPELEMDKNALALLEQGKLQNKDNKGNTLLSNLCKMKKQTFSKKLNGEEIYNQTLANIANPDIIHQGSKGTCTVTTLEYINAKNHPAEYVRIMSGITGKEEKVTLRNGDTIKRPDKTADDDFSGRTAVDRIYQATMMNYGLSEYYTEGEKVATKYDNKKDRFKVDYAAEPGEKTNHDKLKEVDKSLKERGSGLNNEQLNKVMNGVLPYDSKAVSFNSRNREVAEKNMEDALSQGREIPVSLDWDKEGHKLAVEKIDDKYIYMRNPHGDSDKGSGIFGDGPKRKAVYRPGAENSGGHIKMKKDEFYKRLSSYNIPPLSREGIKKNLMAQINKAPETAETYRNMSGEEKEKLMSVAAELYKITEKTMPLVELMDKGMLKDKDSKGNSLLDNLNNLSKQKFADGIDRDSVLSGVILNVVLGSSARAGQNLTDFDIMLEKEQLKNNPAEYTRIVSGLSSTKGEVKLKNGETVKGIIPRLTKRTAQSYVGKIYLFSLQRYAVEKDIGKEEDLAKHIF